MKQLHVICAFFLLMGLSSAQGQTTPPLTEEQQLRKEMDEWMRPYRREEKSAFNQWVNRMEELEIFALEHPIYKHMNSFYRKHRKQYLRLRKADMARYKPAPKILPGYEQVLTLHSTYNYTDFEIKQRFRVLQSMGNFRALGVADTRFGSPALNGFIIKYLATQQGMDNDELLHKFAYGEVPFADLIEGNEWQITFINRMYAWRFNWNIEYNESTDPEVWVYTGGQQPAGWLNNSFPKANTPVQRLERALNTLRWALYDDQPDSTTIDDARRTERLQREVTEFYQSHRKAYIKLRNGALARYPQIDEAYAKAFRKDVPALKEDFLTMLDNNDSLYQLSQSDAPYEIDGARILFQFYYLCMKHSGQVNYYNMTPWVGGQDVHTKELAKNNWEIQAFFQHYALNFHWNLATDEISNIIIRTSETDAPAEDTYEIMVKPAESNP